MLLRFDMRQHIQESIMRPLYMRAPTYIRETAEGVTVAIKVQPRASANEILDVAGNELRIKVTAPPVDAAANEALIKFLAEKVGCTRNKVELMRGHTSRHKVVRLHGLTAASVLAALTPTAR
jgi:uncharacterized protein (TIGR00251 family)